MASIYIKPFSKHAAFLILEYLSIQSSRRPFDADVKSEIVSGMYSLLDLCNDHGREFILANCDASVGSKPIFKALMNDWSRNAKFQG
jgi:hypothetical protein